MAENPKGIALIRSGRQLTLGSKLALTLTLSFPAIMAQLSNIVMQYIDAAMVGRLGETAAASIGLVSTTTWLFFGLMSAAATGFAVQVAHLIGASRRDDADTVLRQSFSTLLIYSAVIAVIGCCIAPELPQWLGGDGAICDDATAYFTVFSLSVPVLQLNFLAASMLRCSGNMAVPGLLNIAMCLLDVVFNMLLIFPTREVTLWGTSFELYGAGLGVTGAALGTAAAEAVSVACMVAYLCRRKGALRLPGPLRDFRLRRSTLRKALGIGLPMGIERIVFCSAQILITVIVAPLGNAAIAANAFSITIESLCYMPGFGIADAATTLIGQSLGAGRKDLARSFGRLTVCTGVAMMTVCGVLMYIFAPQMIGMMTGVEAVKALSVEVLRIEAFTEPLYAVSIVAYGVFVGAGDTVRPCCMNLVSMWAVRLPLAWWLSRSTWVAALLGRPTPLGLAGVWFAMAVELSFRGLIFMIRLLRERWLRHTLIHEPSEVACDTVNSVEVIDTYKL